MCFNGVQTSSEQLITGSKVCYKSANSLKALRPATWYPNNAVQNKMPTIKKSVGEGGERRENEHFKNTESMLLSDTKQRNGSSASLLRGEKSAQM